MTEIELQHLIAQPEGRNLEFKAATSALDFKDVCRYCVALGNEGGGHLILGVSDKSPRMVVGTNAAQSPEGYEAKLFETLRFRVEVRVQLVEDKRVVVLRVPPCPPKSPYSYEGTYLMRSGSSLVPMSNDQLRRLLSDGTTWFDMVARHGLIDIEVANVLDVQTFYDLVNQPNPFSPEAFVKELIARGLLVKENGKYGITNGCAYLLAKDFAQFPGVATKSPMVTIYEGRSKATKTIASPRAKFGIAVGFPRLVSFVMSNLPRNEQLRDSLRVDVELLPEDAIRELIANALVHQDLDISGSRVQIDIYSDRIEISNPGVPQIPTSRFIDGQRSRNEKYANLMWQFRICEERGQGVDKIIRYAELFQLQAPLFEETNNGVQVVLMFGSKKFSDMTREERIRACYQHCVLRYIGRDYMTNSSLRERFKLPAEKSKTVSVSQVIDATLTEGLIVKHESSGESRKSSKYVPTWAKANSDGFI